MGRRPTVRQEEMFVAMCDIRGLRDPFYERLNKVLHEADFDGFAEDTCKEFYAGRVGRPGIPPGTYFRMLMVGYMEGVSSERGIARLCATMLPLRSFLGCGLTSNPPDHSSLSRTRRLLSKEVHDAVFAKVLGMLRCAGLVKGKTLGVDATELRANAALRAIKRRADGKSYEECMEEAAKAAGIEEPTREEMVRVDRKRRDKGSNEVWVHRHDPDARIAKVKGGGTHMVHKLENAVDLDSGAVVGTTVQATDGGDTASLPVTVEEADRNLDAVGGDAAAEVVCDKGYHSNATMVRLKASGKRSYVSEPNRGRRSWKRNPEAQQPTYLNRRRMRGNRGTRLSKRRGEKVERSFAHMLETGGMRRVHVRGRENVRKRILMHAAAFNLGILMRKLCGYGTPRSLQGLATAAAGLAP